jgi:hypothetical protein
VPVYSCYFGSLDFVRQLHEVPFNGVEGVCQNEELLKDFQKYGPTNQNGEPNFDLEIQICGWSFLAKAKETLANCKKNWKGKLY